jgi:DNA processing protein
MTESAFSLLVDLCSIPKMTEARLRKLLKHYKEPARIFEGGQSELAEFSTAELAREVKHYRRTPETEERLARGRELGVKAVTFLDPGYPANLKTVEHAPPVLFMRGEVVDADRKALAVIGTRRATPYGMMVAQKMARGLAEHGVTVVSGLARGIDTAAHIGALAGKGRTIAVLGCGVDVYYPPENRRLYDQIAAQGAVVSEFNLGTSPDAYRFPVRNRVISGLSQAVLAVEARDSSGVLNTVRWAADQGRDVLAIPGTITADTSQGTNELIKDGARPVTTLEDLLEVFAIAPQPARQPDMELSDVDRRLLDCLSENPAHVDDLARETGQPMPVLLGQLLELEIRGLIRQLPGMMFVRDYR